MSLCKITSLQKSLAIFLSSQSAIVMVLHPFHLHRDSSAAALTTSYETISFITSDYHHTIKYAKFSQYFQTGTQLEVATKLDEIHKLLTELGKSASKCAIPQMRICYFSCRLRFLVIFVVELRLRKFRIITPRLRKYKEIIPSSLEMLKTFWLIFLNPRVMRIFTSKPRGLCDC